jgi:hypothetical protein
MPATSRICLRGGLGVIIVNCLLGNVMVVVFFGGMNTPSRHVLPTACPLCSVGPRTSAHLAIAVKRRESQYG